MNPLHGAARGEIMMIGAEIDAAYLERLKTLVLDPPMVSRAKDLRIVFTPIHGTGGVLTRPALEALKLTYTTVPEQDVMDGRFPTVKSPNPENAEALSMGMKLADEQDADLVVATDPDCDRMGVAARDEKGKLVLLSGNQIGSLMAYYRLHTLFDQGILNERNKKCAVIIKTFVTTDLQKAIADHYGVRCIETLTGFKYIGQKLGIYEAALPDWARDGYRQKPESETRALRLKESSYYVFGGEESYGLQRRGFRARQGWQRRDGHVRGGRGICEIARTGVDATARRDLREVRFLPRKTRHADAGGRGWRVENPAIAGVV